MDHRNANSPLAGAVLTGLYQCGEEVKKDWLFELILVAWILPCLGFRQESFHASGKIREGTPRPFLTLLAHFRLLLHHLF
jgi:hypothetical protein